MSFRPPFKLIPGERPNILIRPEEFYVFAIINVDAAYNELGRQILNNDPYVKYVKDNTEMLEKPQLIEGQSPQIKHLRFTVNDILHRYMYVAWSVDKQNNWIWRFTEEDFRTKYDNITSIKALHTSILAFLDNNNLFVA